MNINNTIIVYASRHGTTGEYAKKLLKLLNGNVDLCSLDERANSMPDMTFYDTIVIGGSIHYGKNSKLILNFVKNNLELLRTRRLGLFVTSYFDGEKALEQLNNAYPKELIDKAIVVDYFDGELLYPKMNFFEKLVAKAVLRAEELQPLIAKSKIIDFADKLNQ
ncbi:MAG TPA: flavodoxin domain-containing protein [Dysgonamonadaceae bacterium]|nr:flavodoxin domain-containing protein [Dysgonamonadaceae bacterium]